ncbi:MAG: hypothetical protein KF819_17570 [Labilithrix sp.]|nr:hypothetical protein [Labilithrix sp.]
MSNARRRGRTRIVLFLVTVFAVVFARPASHHARAARLLVTFSDTEAKPEIVEEMTTVEVPASDAGPARTVKARMFAPPGADRRALPATVLVHGVQYRGIEEPRLQRFARSVASAGLVVFTPQIDELADYHVAPRAIDIVGASIGALRAQTGKTKVGVMGVSFGGGISLLTAADRRFADDVSFVVAIGAHDDLERVSGFFARDEIPEVSGATKKMQAHGYGAMVLLYTHAADFFPTEDVPAARDALRFWLWEKRDEAREAAKRLSPASKKKIDRVFDVGIDEVRDQLIEGIRRRAPEMKRVSPHQNLGGLRANVYLLHGEGDTVIPATETMWLASDVPPASLRAVLVSPAIVHVELKEPTLGDKWALVHFMGQVVSEAESSR